MPNWKFHNKWATRFGIPIKISNWVNKREDLPKFESSNDKRLQKFRETIPNTPPTYEEMSEKGIEYLNAWLIHILIDEIEDICEFLSSNPCENLYECAKQQFLSNALYRLAPSEIAMFINNNLDEIIKEIPCPEFHITNNLYSSNKIIKGTKNKRCHTL